MNTISKSFRVQATFKRAQLLPVLTPEMVTGGNPAATFPAVWPRTESQFAPGRAGRAFTSTRLPAGRFTDRTEERIFFALLALSAAAALGQMFAAMIELAPNWPMFDAWVARLLG